MFEVAGRRGAETAVSQSVLFPESDTVSPQLISLPLYDSGFHNITVSVKMEIRKFLKQGNY